MNDELEGLGRRWQCPDRETAVTHKNLPVRIAGASAEIRHDHLPTHKPLSSLLGGESYQRRTVSWSQVDRSPQMGQVATYSVCSCVIVQIGSTDCEHVWRKRDVSSSILAISLLPPSVHSGDCTKNWFSGSCSCSKVKKTGI